MVEVRMTLHELASSLTYRRQFLLCSSNSFSWVSRNILHSRRLLHSFKACQGPHWQPCHIHEVLELLENAIWYESSFNVQKMVHSIAPALGPRTAPSNNRKFQSLRSMNSHKGNRILNLQVKHLVDSLAVSHHWLNALRLKLHDNKLLLQEA